MALITPLTGEKIVVGPIWNGQGAADPAHGSGHGQIWSPTAAALSPNRFVVAALYDNDAGTPPDYTRYLLIDETGTVLQTTDLTYLQPYYDMVGLLTLDATHLLEVKGGLGGSSPGITVRRISVSDTTGFSVDYETTTPLPAEGAEDTYAATWPQIYLPSQQMAIHVLQVGTSQMKMRAIDTTNGQVLWTHYEPISWGTNGSLTPGLSISGTDKVTVTFEQNSHYATYSTDTSYAEIAYREYTVDHTGPTPTGDITTLGSGLAAFESGMVGDHYLSPPGYLQFHQDNSTYQMEFAGFTGGTTAQCTTGATTSYGVQIWPDNRPIQQGLPFVAFGYQSYDSSNNLEGVRVLCWDPSSGGIELTDPFDVTLMGVTPTPSTYATWREYDEVRNGGISVAFDPASGVGIMAVTFVMQQTYSSSQYLQMSVWMLQGPANKPNLTASLVGVEVHFAG